MRKLTKIIGILLIILPIKVNALTGSIGISCDKTSIAQGASTTCRIVGNSNGEVSGVSATIELGNGLTLSSVNKDSIWQGSGEGGIFDLYTDENKVGTFNIGNFVVTASSGITSGTTISIKVKNIVFTDPATDFQEVSISDASTSIRIASTVNTLSSLTVSGATINFNPNTTTYNVTINAASTTISAIATDSNASVSGTGIKTLNYGTNTFNVIVTSESGDTKTYTINVTRPKPQTNPDNNNNNQSTNKPSTNNNSNNNNDSKEEKKSNNNYLGSLKVNGKDLKITKDETDYKLTVENDIKELNISYKADDDKATIKLEGDKNLKVGENTFKITVTAEDGSTKEYTLTVIRAEKGKEVSKNNYLKSLKVDNYDIDFNKNTLEYTIKIKDETSLKITATPEDSKTKTQIVGNNNLQDGSKVKIIVTAEDGSTREYTLNITKENNLLLPIILVIAFAIVIVLFAILLWRNKKNKRG